LLVVCATPATTRAVDALPKAVVVERSFDFGRVARGTVIRKSFAIQNTGTAALLIEGMQFSMPGMRAHVPQSIAPGASAELAIDWDTSQYTREAESQALILLNDPSLPRLALRLAGYVVSPIDVEPMPAFYLSQFQGESSAQTVTIRSNGERAVQVTRTEGQGDSFLLDVQPIEPGRVYAVTATAVANLSPGEYHESALVFTDDPERPRIRFDVYILVKDEVHASADAIDIGEVRMSSLRADPSVLDLLRQTLLLESHSADLRIREVSCDLPFISLTTKPAAPSRRARVDVGLVAANLHAGNYSGTLRITTGVRARPVVELPVRLTILD
jgi:hypothetical protein